MAQCPWKIRFGMSADMTVQCAKPAHAPLDEQHESLFNGITRIVWYHGDRRNYTEEWPGYCTKIGAPPFMGGCVLPLNHHGRCAP